MKNNNNKKWTGTSASIAKPPTKVIQRDHVPQAATSTKKDTIFISYNEFFFKPLTNEKRIFPTPINSVLSLPI